MESRLDRIEKNLELFLHGTLELKESQKKTDEQILELKESQKKTDERIEKIHIEMKESRKKTDERIEKIHIEMKESRKKTDEQIFELKESQKKTDERIEKIHIEMKESRKETDERIEKIHIEMRESRKKTDERIEKIRIEMKESRKETDERIEKIHIEMRESRKETDERIEKIRIEIKESQRKIDEQIEKTHIEILKLDDSYNKLEKLLENTIKKLDDVGRQLADIGLVQGEIAEELFYRNIKNLFKKRNMVFCDIQRNLKKKGIGEYDIVASDKKNVLVVEVKNKITNRMVDRFVNKRLPLFKQIFPEYKDRRLVGGIGALVVKDEVGIYAEKSGLFVLTQTDDGGAGLLNNDKFKPKEFSEN